MFVSPVMTLLASTAFILLKRSASFLPSSVRVSSPRSSWLKKETRTLSMTIFTTSEKDEEVVQSMLYRIRQCNYMPQEARKSMVDFVVEGASVGKCTTKVAVLLCRSSPSEPVFQLQSIDGKKQLSLTEYAGLTKETRTDAVMTVMEKLRSEGVINGWRDELYPLSSSFYSEPLLLVERAAAPFLGIKQYGVHINGIVKNENGENDMWMARRSKTKSKYPGMLDQVVAGGQPHGYGLTENVIKECMEEAGIPEDMAVQGLQAAGVVSYEDFEEHPSDLVDGIFQTVILFNYDLHLPKDFIPIPMDGEVDHFFKWTMKDVLESMHPNYHDPIKPNCYLCIIDYLLRNGLGVSMETKGYLDVFHELRSGDCS
jgi:isopentenyldiphosphate isomerase